MAGLNEACRSSVESIWPASAFGGLLGEGNLLTSDEPALPAGGAVFHDTAAWMRPELAAMALSRHSWLVPRMPAY